MIGAETELVARAQRGDDGAFEELVNCWRRRVLAIVAHLIGRPEDVEDVGQEVFVRLYFSLPGLREPAGFGPWLYRVATNAAMDYLRKNRRGRVRMADLSEDRQRAIENELSVREIADQRLHESTHDLAEDLLSLLSPQTRTLLVLKEVDGLSIKELSAVYGISEEAVKVRLFRARGRILKRAGGRRSAWLRRPNTEVLNPAPCIAA